MQHFRRSAHIGMEHASAIHGEFAQIVAQGGTFPMSDINREEKRKADTDPQRRHLQDLAGRGQVRLRHLKAVGESQTTSSARHIPVIDCPAQAPNFTLSHCRGRRILQHMRRHDDFKISRKTTQAFEEKGFFLLGRGFFGRSFLLFAYSNGFLGFHVHFF